MEGLSPELLAAALTALPQAAFVLDAQGRCLLASRAAEARLGLPAGELRGRPLRELLEGCGARGRELLAELTLTPLGPAGSLAVLAGEREAGGRSHAEAWRGLLADAGEALIHTLEPERAGTALARAVAPRLAAAAVVYVTSPRDGALRAAGHACGDPARAPLVAELAALPPGTGAHGPAAAVRGGRVDLVEVVDAGTLPALAGSPGRLELLQRLEVAAALTVPLLARSRVIGALCLFAAGDSPRFTREDVVFAEDLGRRAGVALENAQLYHDLAQAGRLKDEFLATLSHELRTPLNAVLGWANLLQSGQLDDEGRERALDTIVRNAHMQSRLVSDILDVSRVVAGQLRIEPRPTDLTLIVEAALLAVRPAAALKAIVLDTRLEAGLPRITADPARVQQVLWNLLSNAVKFTPRGGRVEVHCAPEGESVRLTVSDDGPGIDPDFLPYAFDRFRQADSSTTRRHGGLGLGLAIARHLVELHGGTIEAANRAVGTGAVLTVRLPVRAGLPEGLEPRGPGEAPPARPRLHGLRVLVVEDEADARELYRVVLQGAGAQVLLAGSAAEALELVADERPHAALVDIGLPGRDGFWLIGQLRSRAAGEGGDMPVAALTAYASDQDRTRVLQGGFQHHLTKPIEASTLVAAVAALARPPWA